MKRLSLIRHGESASNAGMVTDGPILNPLTNRGQEQANVFASNWGEQPGLVVTSDFIRTQQTAVPFLLRFPQVKHERWEVHELTQLSMERYKGTTHADRHPFVMEYWERADPDFVDGEGAESFNQFKSRVCACLQRASEHSANDIAIFTHGAFMQAILYYVLRGNLPMKEYFRFSEAFPIENMEVLTFVYDKRQSWTVGRVISPK